MFRLAISQRVVENESYVERRDALSQEWPAYLAEVLPEVALLPVPNYPKGVVAWAHGLGVQGLILSGGNDWGEAPERDETERLIVEYCRTKGLPVLGVCRGLQVLSVVLGGRLETDISSHTEVKHTASEHSVRLTGDSYVELSGGLDLRVNSFHNQGILAGEMAPNCAVFATAPDDIVEGFHHRKERILAIEWHPERSSPSADFDRILLQSFFRDGDFCFMTWEHNS